mgnify:CR=1 FL=1
MLIFLIGLFLNASPFVRWSAEGELVLRQWETLRLMGVLQRIALCALLGALPLMLSHGVGAEMRQPLGITMVGGLIVSQVLTLFTTPVVYLFFDRLTRRNPARKPAAAPAAASVAGPGGVDADLLAALDGLADDAFCALVQSRLFCCIPQRAGCGNSRQDRMFGDDPVQCRLCCGW